jgi:hypothetical protein
MAGILVARDHQGGDKDIDLVFITSTAVVPRQAQQDQTSRRAIRVHAAKAKPNLELGFGRPQKLTRISGPFRDVRREYTSTIKLPTWTRKSGRKAVPKKQIGEQELQVDWSQTPTDIRLLQGLEPVNALPIPFFSNTSKILGFYMSFNTNSLALNPDGDFFDVARSDAAILHGLVSVVGRIRSLDLGIEEDVDVLRHQAEAVTIINERLANGREALSDSLIAAVAVLVNQEVCTLIDCQMRSNDGADCEYESL